MADKWIINSAKAIGREHIRENIPCQDSVRSLCKNGVTVIALSDGCSSSPFSQQGADMTVEVICDLLTNNYDHLYDADDDTVRKAVVTAIVERISRFIKDNSETVSDFMHNSPWRYEELKEKWPGFESVDKLYPITLFDATVQFVAIKDNNIIVCRLGDGIIGDVREGELRLLSSEDKIGVAQNVTYYPSTLLLADEDPELGFWYNFEVLKSNTASEYQAFLIASDGVADGLVGCDSKTFDQVLLPDMVKDLLQGNDRLEEILEQTYKRFSGDDLSVIIMQKPTVEIKAVVLRQYDEDGRTIANDKVRLIAFDGPEAPTVEGGPQNTDEVTDVEAEEEITLTEGQTSRIKSYFGNSANECIEFLTNSAITVKRYLKKNKNGSLEAVRELLRPYAEDDEWKLLLAQFSKLDLFNVDRENGTISEKES